MIFCLFLLDYTLTILIVVLLQDLVKIFLEDNLTLSLPEQFRQSVLRELFQKAQQG